jgi:hypothetical protein
MHSTYEPLLTPSDKMPFEVAPVYIKLAYYKPPVDAAATPATTQPGADTAAAQPAAQPADNTAAPVAAVPAPPQN